MDLKEMVEDAQLNRSGRIAVYTDSHCIDDASVSESNRCFWFFDILLEFCVNGKLPSTDSKYWTQLPSPYSTDESVLYWSLPTSSWETELKHHTLSEELMKCSLQETVTEAMQLWNDSLINPSQSSALPARSIEKNDIALSMYEPAEGDAQRRGHFLMISVVFLITSLIIFFLVLLYATRRRQCLRSYLCRSRGTKEEQLLTASHSRSP